MRIKYRLWAKEDPNRYQDLADKAPKVCTKSMHTLFPKTANAAHIELTIPSRSKDAVEIVQCNCCPACQQWMIIDKDKLRIELSYDQKDFLVAHGMGIGTKFHARPINLLKV